MSHSLYPAETIAAIATAIVPQEGSVGIIRVSGSRALEIARSLFRSPGQPPWESHRIFYGYIRDPNTGSDVDEALLLIMKGPRSYTREDIVEFHCHGGIMVVQQVLSLCLQCGARLAEPGEFSLRAFLNGRIDLTQAESIADLVGARSPQAAQMALAGVRGKLASPIHQLRETCVELLAEIEARIDFEDDLPPLDEPAIVRGIETVLRELTELLSTADRGELLRSGLKVAIVGRPNVGKSSLLNAWSQSDRAIVTDLPGTTRDIVETQLVVHGIPVRVLDTAGIRETTDVVEKIGVARSRQATEEADLVLLTIDGSAGWTAEDRNIYDQISHHNLILIINKIDLVSDPESLECPENIHIKVHTAAARQEGVDRLEQAILQSVNAGQLQAANSDIAINQRQTAALTRAQLALEQVRATIGDRLPLDFWTIDLRASIQALGEVTGDDVTESILQRIFSRFCIGK